MRNLRFAFLVLLVCGTQSHAADYVSMSGEAVYERFCAACHGIQGAGDGPVADSLKVEVPDLRLLARRAGGTFPRDRVIRIIDGRHIIGAHGTRTMPIWGENLSRLEPGDPNAERAAQIVIERLTGYLEQLQRPSVK